MFSGCLSISPGITLFGLFIIFNVMFASTHFKGQFLCGFPMDVKKPPFGGFWKVLKLREKEAIYIDR